MLQSACQDMLVGQRQGGSRQYHSIPFRVDTYAYLAMTLIKPDHTHTSYKEEGARHISGRRWCECRISWPV
jgi:hypothetical protein